MSNTTSLDKITVDLLHRAVNFFRLGRPVSMRSVSEGLANKNYLLETDGGQYLVKDVLIHTPDEIELEMEYLDHILKNNFPAPSYIRGIKGARIFLDSGHILVVQNKFGGEHPEKTQEVCRAVGKWLAKLHKIPHEGLPQKNHWMTPHFLPPHVEILRTSQLPYKEPALASYERLRTLDFYSLPQAIIHNDVYTGNLLFEGSKLTTILDWEETAVSAAILDVASGIRYLCFDESYSLLEQNYKALLMGYLAERKLQQVELDKLRDTVQFVALTGSIWLMIQFGIRTPDSEMLAWGENYWRHNLDDLELPRF